VIAALYVAKNGAYWNLPDVDPWDIDRDARFYTGPHPVVAHPPCQLWVNMAGVNFKRYGGPHNRPGNDGGCFARALESVRTWGGILEHPAFSFAWQTFALVEPEGAGWTRAGASEWTCEVWQSTYGHKARKRTWLFYCGATQPPELDWRREPGTHQVGWFDRKKPSLSKAASNATPPAFRDALLSLARHAATKRDAA
jgi:hypothetical protein